MGWERGLTKHGHETRKGESCARWSDSGLRVQMGRQRLAAAGGGVESPILNVEISPPHFQYIFGEYHITGISLPPF